MDVKEMLLKAADHIERVGLYKGYYWMQKENDDLEGATFAKDRLNRPCCSLGALRTVLLDPETGEESYDLKPVYADAIKSLSMEIFRLTGRSAKEVPIAAWNDDPERTQNEVVAAFRQAAANILTC